MDGHKTIHSFVQPNRNNNFNHSCIDSGSSSIPLIRHDNSTPTKECNPSEKDFK